MKHYVLPDGYTGPGTINIDGEEFHYLTRVLRKRAGDQFTGVDSMGNTVSLVLRSIKPDSCTIEVGEVSAPPESDRPGITLYQCMPKGSKMDLVIRQATETGVHRIVPVVSAYSVPRIKPGDQGKKLDRWLRIARQAMQQSGGKSLPDIVAPIPIKDIAGLWDDSAEDGDVCLFLHQSQVSPQSIHHILSGNPGQIGICIGPEGGFSEGEVEDLLQSGFQPVYINTNVLRTETAALYAIASVQTVLLERDSWTARK